jgi:hypothetical protein
VITPNEYSKEHRDAASRDADQQAQIERFIDGRIKANMLTFPAPRSMWLKENIEIVLCKYRAFGWECSFVNGEGFAFKPQSLGAGG